jgi:hypothetical protein
MLLEQTIARLLDWGCGAPGQPPRPGSVRIAEVTSRSRTGSTLQFRVAELRSVNEYEERFRQLVGSGYAWINLNYCGELRGHGLVLVEHPTSPTRPGDAPSINFSGPPRCMADASWDARDYVTLAP